MSNKLFTAFVITVMVCVVAMTSLLGIAFVRIVLTPEAIATEPTVVCDDVKAYEDNTAVCEVFVRPSSVEQVRNTNSVTEEDRI
jgi:hypothetical protein